MTDSPAAAAPAFLDLEGGRRIAYSRVEARGGDSRAGVVFLGGFRSDMTGTKAVALEAWARDAGRGFLRFDYTGHGASSGAFENGAISDWANDAEEAVTRLTSGPQILVGSSMGGWIMLLLARRLPAERIAGLVGVAAAPDFTEDLMRPAFSENELRALATDGRVTQASPYDDAPTIITRRLIEDGAENLVLRGPLRVTSPVRLLHGDADEDVPVEIGLRLLSHLTCADARLTIVKGAGHRMSEPSEIELLRDTVASIGG